MVYLKSLLAGIVAVLIAATLSPIVMGIYFYLVYRSGRRRRRLDGTRLHL